MGTSLTLPKFIPDSEVVSTLPKFIPDSEVEITQFTGEASPAAMSAHKPLPYTPPQLPGASAVLGPETYFGRQMAGQREDLQQAPLVDLTTMTPEPGILRGAARFASGLTTPTNLALAAGTTMLGAAPAAIKLPQIAAGIFSVDMAKAAYEQFPEFKAAVDAGDIPKAKEIGTELVLTGAFAGMTGAHALRGPKGLLKTEPRVNVEAEPIRPQQPVAEPPAQAPLEPPRVTVDDILNIVKEREQAQRAELPPAEPLPKFIPDRWVTTEPPAGQPIEAKLKEPWEMTKEEFNQEFWYHGRGGTHPLYGQEKVTGGITRNLEEAKGFSRIRFNQPGETKPDAGEVRLLRQSQLPQSALEELELGKKSIGSMGATPATSESAIPSNVSEAHRYLVEKAIAEGKAVPPEVLAEYEVADKIVRVNLDETTSAEIDPALATIRYKSITNPNAVGRLQTSDGPNGEILVENHHLDEALRGHGYGGAAIKKLQDLTKRVIISDEYPSRDAQAMWERLGAKRERVPLTEEESQIRYVLRPEEVPSERPAITTPAGRPGPQPYQTGPAYDTPEGWVDRWKSYREAITAPEAKPDAPVAAKLPPGYTHEPPQAGSLPVFKGEEQMALPKYAGSINLERVGADYPVKKLIRDVYDQYKGKIDERRRGVITQEQTRLLAEELGMTEKDLLKRKLGKAFNAEEVTATRDILNASANRLELLKQQWAKSGSDDAVIEFRKAMDLHAEIQAEASGVATESGRALAAHRMISEPAKGYKKMLDVLGGRELNDEILKQFSQIDASDPRQVNAFVRAYSKVTIWDQLYEAWRSTGLLSGPITHLVNTTSNVITLSTRIPETVIGAGTEAIRAKATGEPRQAFFGEVKPEIVGALAGIGPGMKSALAAWREEIPLSEARFEAHRRYIPGKLGKNIRIPYRLLSAADEMLKSINYSAESYQLAYRKARVAGVKGKEALARETLAHLQDKDIVESANKAAQYWTFNQPLGPWSMKVNQLRETIPGARYIIPFLRTSTNIAKFGLERTPLNFARIMREYHRGNLKGVELSEEMAKPILGTMIGAATVMLAAEGYITGSGPKNQNERETLLRSGWRPYAFKIGDTYYPYGRLEPIGSVVGMAADFAEAKGLEKPSQVASKIAQSISKNLTSKTFMQGFSSLNDAISDPDRYGQKFLKSFAGTLIPNIVATTAKAIDPYQRITEGPLQAMQARIPGASLSLPPKRDVLGREVKQQGLLPIGTKSKEFIDQELVRVKAWIGDLDKKDMTAQQFDEYAQRVGQVLRPRLEVILKSGQSDDIKREMAKRAASDARSQVRRSMMIPAKKKGG